MSVPTLLSSAAPTLERAQTQVPARGHEPTPPKHVATVTVVIPTKNEARNIGWVLERLPSTIDEVIIVDGQSTDGTTDIAKMIFPDVVILREERPGKGAAMRAGFAAATSEYVVVMDADGSMDPADIAAFVDKLDEGYDFVKGSRFLPGGGTTDITPLRQFGNSRLLELANLMFGTAFSELCYGFMAFRRACLPALCLDADGFEIETQIVLRSVRANLAIAEVPSMEAPRRFGESNLNTFRDGWRVLSTMFAERFAPTPVTVMATADVSVPAAAVAQGEEIAA